MPGLLKPGARNAGSIGALCQSNGDELRCLYMLARELLVLGKPMEEVTLSELRVAYDRIHEQYNSMMDRLKHIRE